MSLSAFAYENPLLIRNIGDPAVLKFDGKYYLYATTNIMDGSTDAGIKCWISPDLVAWEGGPWVLLAADRQWGRFSFFGPEVHHFKGKFLMLYSATAVQNGLHRLCLAESDSPTGPFRDVIAPMFEGPYGAISPRVFRDNDDRTYLYWSSMQGTQSPIAGQEITSDLRTLLGAPNYNILGAPFSDWERNKWGYPIAEVPMILKHNGLYYLSYSGSGYDEATYAVGYATSTTPLGTFSRYPGNPILKSDFTGKRRVSGPAAHHFVESPDGTETMIVYAAHTNPDIPSGDRTVYMDRIAFEDGILKVIGPTTSCQPDPSHGSVPTFNNCYDDYYTTATLPEGWDLSGLNIPGIGYSYFDPGRDAFVLHVSKNSGGRVTGVATSNSEWFPYSEIGPDNYVRVKYAVYAANQQNPNDPTEVPNFRFRAATRFAATASMDIFHHAGGDAGVTTVAGELAPSRDPEKPSVYTLDFDPIDVPLMSDGSTTEGIMRGFEVFCLEPQENGDICMVESSVSVYPKSSTPQPGDPATLMKVLEPGLTDAGSLKVLNTATDIRKVNWIEGLYIGDSWTVDTISPKGTVREAGLNSVSPPPGVTLDTADIPTNRFGTLTRDFTPAPEYTAPDYLRAEPGKQYKIRWHLTSTGASNENAVVQMRVRSVRWSWNQKLQLGGAHAAGPRNNALAAQVLPGIGCLNPEKDGNENGGWYTMIFNTPLDSAIRPEFAPDVDISQRMPNLYSEPGPQTNAPSRRDIRLGLDLLDTFSRTPDRDKEKGNVTVDRIEVYVYDAVI